VSKSIRLIHVDDEIVALDKPCSLPVSRSRSPSAALRAARRGAAPPQTAQMRHGHGQQKAWTPQENGCSTGKAY